MASSQSSIGFKRGRVEGNECCSNHQVPSLLSTASSPYDAKRGLDDCAGRMPKVPRGCEPVESVRGVKRDGTVTPADPAGRKRLKVRFKDETEAVEAVDPNVGVHKNLKAAKVGGWSGGPRDAEEMSGGNKHSMSQQLGDDFEAYCQALHRHKMALLLQALTPPPTVRPFLGAMTGMDFTDNQAARHPMAYPHPRNATIGLVRPRWDSSDPREIAARERETKELLAAFEVGAEAARMQAELGRLPEGQLVVGGLPDSANRQHDDEPGSTQIMRCDDINDNRQQEGHEDGITESAGLKASLQVAAGVAGEKGAALTAVRSKLAPAVTRTSSSAAATAAATACARVKASPVLTARDVAARAASGLIREHKNVFQGHECGTTSGERCDDSNSRHKALTPPPTVRPLLGATTGMDCTDRQATGHPMAYPRPADATIGLAKAQWDPSKQKEAEELLASFKIGIDIARRQEAEKRKRCSEGQVAVAGLSANVHQHQDDGPGGRHMPACEDLAGDHQFPMNNNGYQLKGLDIDSELLQVHVPLSTAGAEKEQQGHEATTTESLSLRVTTVSLQVPAGAITEKRPALAAETSTAAAALTPATSNAGAGAATNASAGAGASLDLGAGHARELDPCQVLRYKIFSLALSCACTLLRPCGLMMDHNATHHTLSIQAAPGADNVVDLQGRKMPAMQLVWPGMHIADAVSLLRRYNDWHKEQSAAYKKDLPAWWLTRVACLREAEKSLMYCAAGCPQS